MLSEEEKKAIDYLKKYINWETYGERSLEADISTILNLIEKQQKELEQEKEKYKRLQNTEAFQECYISKDKIKEEIEHLSKNILDIENITMLKGKTLKEQAEIELYKYAICVLTRLLEEK